MPDDERKIRIMRVCPVPGYLERFRKQYQLAGRPYAQQVRILQQESIYLPGGWAECMEKLGFEVCDTLYGDFQLAAQWAEENNALECFFGTNPLFDILKRQVLDFKPDIIAFWTGSFFRVDRVHRMELRKLLSKPVVIMGLWGDEVPFGETYSSYFGDVDFMLTVNTTYQRHFEDAGIRAHTIASAFDESVRFSPPKEKSREFTFCGDTGFGKLDHINRYDLLCEIAARSNIQIFAHEPKIGKMRRRLAIAVLNAMSFVPYAVLYGFDRILSGRRITRGMRLTKGIKLARLVRRTGVSAAGFFPSSKHPRQNYFNGKRSLKRLFPGKVTRGPLESAKYYELLAGSKIVLNIHRDEEADYGNIRCFEATGVGVVLLTDHGEQLKEFFNIETEVVTFTTAQEALEKLDFLLKNPDVMERIAAAGRRRTLRDHTVMKRCEALKPILLQEYQRAVEGQVHSRTYVYATYDTNRYPISYDIAFFVEAAEILRRHVGAQGTIVNILYPNNIAQLAGVSAESDLAVDRHGREFRLTHVCGQIARMFPGVTVNEVKSPGALISPESDGARLIHFPGPELPHHTEYYRIVNANPALVEGLRASRQAVSYIANWLATFKLPSKRLVCITVRDYAFDVQRNSKLEEWVKFIESLNEDLYEVVIVPDADQLATYHASLLANYRAFWPACFDVDLRYALYESAYLNLFVNNGPATASSLNRNVRHLMFKLLVPGVPHCTEEFVTWSGFPANGSPVYATKFQKWVWEDDDFEVIQREFNSMVREIEAARQPTIEGPRPLWHELTDGRASATRTLAPVNQDVVHRLRERDTRPPSQPENALGVANSNLLIDRSK